MKLVSVVLFVGLVLVSCGQKDENSVKEVKKLLKKGQWELVSAEEKIVHFQSGMKFSSDKQVFYIDSQGHVIPPHHEILYSVSGDTLTIVDYKWEPHLIYENGTDILLIKELDDEKMVLVAVHPKGPNEIVFERR